LPTAKASARLPMLTTDLVRLRVAVLLASTTPPALAAKAATAAIPIVFVLGVDPVELGLVASLNRPDVNVTGVTFLVQQLVAKRLELLCEIAPTPAPIGMLADQGNPNAESDVRNALGAAAALGRTLHVAKIAAASDIEPAITTLMQQRVSAVFVAPHANFRIWRPQLLSLMARHALPASFSSSDFVTAGGLMSYGPDQFDSYREAASMSIAFSRAKSLATCRSSSRRSSSWRSISRPRRRLASTRRSHCSRAPTR
jgi:putative ABC transport system substrate-binding protein